MPSLRPLLTRAFAAALALGLVPAPPPAAQPARAALSPQDAVLRPYANGAGPSAIFRLGRDAAGHRDLFGVVDPVLWRIQYFTLDDPSPAAAPLSQRWRRAGDCALGPAFRVWRVHALPGRVVLQSQPRVTAAALSRPGAAFASDKVTLDSRPAAVAAIIARAPTDPELAPAEPCAAAAAAPARFDPALDAAAQVTGGGDRAFVVRRRHLPPGAGPFLRAPVRLADAPAVLVSAQELEPAGSLRHFIVTARSGASPGFVRAVVTVERRAARPALNRTLRIDLGLTRVKSGQKFVAVSSVGEVLVIGTADHDSFYVHACRFQDGAGAASVCHLESHPADAATGPPVALPPGAHALTAVSRGDLWTRVWWYALQTYQIDAGAIPAPCRRVAPCRIGGAALAWSPISELRLASGVVRRIGVPYAQSQSLDGRPAPGRAIAFPTTGVIPAYALRRGAPWVVSDIENTGVRDNPAQVAVLGVDCSAFVSFLWGRGHALGTREFIDEANHGALARVSSMAKARMGDAFVINLAATINHIAVFREERPAGPLDSSRVILVAESSSGCGGVCWSVYDESFFDGWAIVRNAPGAPTPDMAPIPINYDGWRRLFAGA